MDPTTENYTEEYISVNDLGIDHRVQRDGLNKNKVDKIVKDYNVNALGIITVSYRKDRSYIIIDGMHRWEANRRVTDARGVLKCRVFANLTLAEEAQMFLDLNETTKPPKIDAFKVLQNADGPDAVAARDIQELLNNYGWTISRTPANGHINAVMVVQRIYKLSKSIDADPNLVLITILAITRAWGNNRHGAVGSIFEALGRMFAVYGSKMDLDRLIQVLKEFDPLILVSEAHQLKAIRKGKLSMSIADILVEKYNQGRRTKLLERWKARN